MTRRIVLTALLSILLIFSINCENLLDEIEGLEDLEEELTGDFISGSGVLITEPLELPEFHSIENMTAGRVNLTYGTTQSVSVTADDNINEYFTAEVRNSKLVITKKRNAKLKDYELIYDITITDLEELTVNSAGSFVGTNKFEAGDVVLTTNSAGSISLELETNELLSYVNSAGSIKLSGIVYEHRAFVSSAGSLYAFDLSTNKTIINLSSVGCAEVYVTEILDATVSSLGSLYYKGNPQVYQTVTSFGRVINAN